MRVRLGRTDVGLRSSVGLVGKDPIRDRETGEGRDPEGRQGSCRGGCRSPGAVSHT